MKKIAMIGLGMMGLGMGTNLINKGFDVTGFDIRSENAKAFEAKGGKIAKSVGEAGKDTDAAVVMVFNADQVRDVIFSAGGLKDNMKKGSVIIVTASVGKDILEESDEKLKGSGIYLVDASVRANFSTAAAGEMYIMASGSNEAYNTAEEFLKAMGTTIVRIGEKPGQAQIAKSCMQAFFSLMFEATSEVLSIGTAAGLNPKAVYDILNATGASNGIFRNTAKNISSGTFNGTNNPMAILEKDSKLACSLAHKYGMKVPALEGTAENFEACMKKHPSDDIWACVKSFEESAGIEVRFDFEE